MYRRGIVASPRVASASNGVARKSWRRGRRIAAGGVQPRRPTMTDLGAQVDAPADPSRLHGRLRRSHGRLRPPHARLRPPHGRFRRPRGQLRSPHGRGHKWPRLHVPPKAVHTTNGGAPAGWGMKGQRPHHGLWRGHGPWQRHAMPRIVPMRCDGLWRCQAMPWRCDAMACGDVISWPHGLEGCHVLWRCDAMACTNAIPWPAATPGDAMADGEAMPWLAAMRCHGLGKCHACGDPTPWPVAIICHGLW